MGDISMYSDGLKQGLKYLFLTQCNSDSGCIAALPKFLLEMQETWKNVVLLQWHGNAFVTFRGLVKYINTITTC